MPIKNATPTMADARPAGLSKSVDKSPETSPINTA